ncbi:hypothetical protein ACIBSW_38310 [Actinoplanes sp. NPDC049668]|uniref:hypothetical protein n=1 Tax=unclassified Actinoplanes TaxID=2626549 RepID=UPI0033A7FA1D
MRSRAIQELEPMVAAGRALDALLEAGRYSGHGLTTAGERLGRRAAAAGVEGAHRTGDAWAVLRGAPPPRRGFGALALAAAAGCAVGAVAALAVQRVIAAWRAEEAGYTQPAAGTEEPATLPEPATRGAAE